MQAHSRRPMEMMALGLSMSLVQASQAASTM